MRLASGRRVVILSILALVGVLVAILGAGQIVRSRHEALRYGALNLARQGQTAATTIEWAFDSANLFQHMFIDDIQLKGFASPEEFAREMRSDKVHRDLVIHNALLPSRGDNILIGADGLVINSSMRDAKIGASVADVEYFRQFRNNPDLDIVVSNPFDGHLVNSRLVLLLHRVRAPGGAWLGLIASGFRADYFEGVYESVRPADGAQMQVLRRDGRVLFRSNASKAAPDIETDTSPSFVSFVNGPSSATRVTEAATGSDDETIVCYSRLSREPLVVAIAMSTSAMLRNWRGEAWYFGAALLAIEAVIVWLAMLIVSLGKATDDVMAARNVQRLAEQRELEAARELESVIGTMPGVVTLQRRRPDGAWRVLYVSPSVTEKTGFTPEEIMNPGWVLKRLGASQLRLLREREDEALRTGYASLELTVCFPNRTLRKLHVAIGRIGVEGGATDVSTVWADVTQERALTAQLAQASRFATLGEMATGMAHELGTPLATIMLAAENALHGIDHAPKSPAQMKTKLETIVRLSARTSDLLDHLRKFGRADDGRIEPGCLHDVADRAALLLTPRLERHAVLLKTDLPADLPRVLAKIVPLEQVLINIVSNACDAYACKNVDIPPERRTVEIGAIHDPDKMLVTVSVQDHAGGIQAGNLAYVFESFFTTKPPDKGTGLGLAICQRAIAEMGGIIWVENGDGGAVFRFTLQTEAAGG